MESSVTMEDNHNLNTNWTMWAHLPHDTDWSLDLTTFIIPWEEPWPLTYGPFPNRETTS